MRSLLNSYTTASVAWIARRNPHYRTCLFVGLCAIFVHCPQQSYGQIRDCRNGSILVGTDNITPGAGMWLVDWNSKDRTLDHADFRNLTLDGSVFWRSSLNGACFQQASLRNADFDDAQLNNANFTGAELSSANFRAASLTGADFTGASIHRTSFAIMTSRGFTAKQLYSTASYQTGNLQYLDLHDNDLSGWDFRNQDLSNADLSWAELRNARFDGAIIQGASFSDRPFFRDPPVVGLSQQQLYSTASYQTGQLQSIDLSTKDLTGWDFRDQNLKEARFNGSKLDGTDFSRADLTSVEFNASTYSNAKFEGATINNARFNDATEKGFDALQLYSTASYRAGDLRGVSLEENNLRNWDFRNQDLTNSSFEQSDLTNTRFDNAVVVNGNFTDTTARGFTSGQLYATASYQTGNLEDIDLSENDLSGWSFRDQNLAEASFFDSNLTNADFLGADLRNAGLSAASLAGAGLRGASIQGAQFNATTVGGFTARQLYETASYQARDLKGIELESNVLTGWDFRDQDLSGAQFYLSDLSKASFDNAWIQDARFGSLTPGSFTAEQLYATSSYKVGNLQGVDLSRNDLNNWDFSNQSLTTANFEGANLSQADFRGADLTRSNFVNAELSKASFADAVVREASFSQTTSGGFTQDQLDATTSYRNQDLYGINLSSNNLDGWDFRWQNLQTASFNTSSLRNANFEGASIQGADFSGTTLAGFTADQLYSTASYREGDLSNIRFQGGDDLSGWDFSGQNLASSVFDGAATLNGTNFAFADLRNAAILTEALAESQLLNTILPSGNMAQLNLFPAETLVIRDSDLPIHVSNDFNLRGGELEFLFADHDWGSTITVETEFPRLDGSLAFRFAAGVQAADLVGTTFDLFNWKFSQEPRNGLLIDALPGHRWDTSRLFSHGEVSLLSVPEPNAGLLFVIVVGSMAMHRRKSAAAKGR